MMNRRRSNRQYPYDNKTLLTMGVCFLIVLTCLFVAWYMR